VAVGKVDSDGTELDVAGASVVRNATGEYTVNLDTALSSDNYSVQLTVEEGSNLDDIEINITNQTSSGFDVVITEQDNGGDPGTKIDKKWHFLVVADSSSLGSLSIDNDTLGGLSCNDGQTVK
jgi:hypothetical protein